MNQPLQIRSALAAEQLPTPSLAWIQSLVASQASAPATARTLPALVAAAKARLLSADLTTPGLLEGTPAGFPPQLLRATAGSVQETRLSQDIVVQVLDLENLSQSRWQQVQALEAIERGEQKRGREIIRVAAPSDGGEVTDGDNDAANGRPNGVARPAAAGGGGGGDANATHRLVLQDASGNTVFAIELSRIYRIGIGRLRIGEKVLLKSGTVAARGTLLLEPTNVKFLGGQIEALNKAWTEGRLKRLRDAANAE